MLGLRELRICRNDGRADSREPDAETCHPFAGLAMFCNSSMSDHTRHPSKWPAIAFLDHVGDSVGCGACGP